MLLFFLLFGFSSSSSADGGNGNESDESEFEEGSSVGYEERLKLKILLQLIKNMAKRKPRVVSMLNPSRAPKPLPILISSNFFNQKRVPSC